MDEDNNLSKANKTPKSHGAFNITAFLIAFLFVLVVFNNFALALIFGAVLAGGSKMAQRSSNKNPK